MEQGLINSRAHKNVHHVNVSQTHDILSVSSAVDLSKPPRNWEKGDKKPAAAETVAAAKSGLKRGIRFPKVLLLRRPFHLIGFVSRDETEGEDLLVFAKRHSLCHVLLSFVFC